MAFKLTLACLIIAAVLTAETARRPGSYYKHSIPVRNRMRDAEYLWKVNVTDYFKREIVSRCVVKELIYNEKFVDKILPGIRIYLAVTVWLNKDVFLIRSKFRIMHYIDSRLGVD